MTVTVFGTGTLRAFAVNDRPDPLPILAVTRNEHGFRAELTASMETFSAVRQLTLSMPLGHEVTPDLAEKTALVVSELMGNAKRATPDSEAARLIVEVSVTATGLEVSVHDAAPGQPTRRDVPLDDAEATAGRGLALLDVLTDYWTVEPSSLGKKIRCHLS
ncbi:ATP-binding protein [Streptomyces sp. NBC_00687]|uniref:ATP-binding protein n=1 Tax=Streptomyces sp. NBC_00687 TaxID=2975807 RepID=UPI00224E1F81|nr:ATP-binding protein [Streptomyces sp. NBC_00687]MCX4919947.1 ATP-binding protein [Streptomyces sp. NBC_00687]